MTKDEYGRFDTWTTVRPDEIWQTVTHKSPWDFVDPPKAFSLHDVCDYISNSTKINKAYILGNFEAKDEKRKEDTMSTSSKQSKTPFELSLEHMKKLEADFPKPDRIDQHKTATVVHWSDGTYTAVNCASGTSDASIYAAFAAAVCKKLYGSTSAVHKLVDRHNGERLDRIANEEKEKRVAEQAAAEKRNHDRELRRMVKEMKLRMEASAVMFGETVDSIADEKEV